MNALFNTCKKIIDEKKIFLLTTHVDPDGDGLGSEIALARHLKKRGKAVSILNHSSTPPNYRFLDPKGEIIQFDPILHAGKVQQAEVIFIIDTNHLDRLRSLEPYVRESRAIKICVDHHLDPDLVGADYYLIDVPATATGEIIYHLLQYLDDHKIDSESARALYTAIMTDTGSFRFPRTDPEIHRVAAHLIECGANPPEIFQEVYEKSPLSTLQLLSRALSNLKTAENGRVAFMIVTREMLQETGASEIQTENFIDYTMRVGGVQIGLLFSEFPDGVKISFRSKGKIPVNELAKEFGGNGHFNAAGARLFDRSLDEVVEAVLRRAAAYVE